MPKHAKTSGSSLNTTNNWQTPAELTYNTVPASSGAVVDARHDVVIIAAQPAVAGASTVAGQAPVAATGTAGTGAVGTNHAVTGGSTVSAVAAATSSASTGTVSTNNGVTKANAPSPVGKVVRSSNSTTAQLPNNSLYIIQPTSGNHSPKGYLVETDPRFTQNKLWLGSDYMLKQMGYDPATQTQRLGDGFYEQKLIREQIAQLTGRRFLDDNNGEQYANDEAQYQALMNAGLQFAKDYELIPGVALTAEQMALLTTDIVWLVSKTVTLPDGSTTQVLVPQVYALVKPGDIDGSGNLLSAKSIDLKLKGDMVNSGLMAARGNLSIDAANIVNLTGTLKGLDISLLASQDIQSIQGNIMAGNTLKVGAGNDVVIKAGNVTAGGNASITAGNDLLILAQDKGRQVSINFGKRDKDGNLIDPNNKDNILNFGTYDQTGTNLNVGGSLSLSAGNDFYSQGAQVSAGAGISVHAGSKALSVTAKHGSFYESSQVNKQKTWFGLGSITTTDTVNKTDVTNTMSNWNGGAGGVSFTASGVATTVGTNMAGNGGINIKGGKETNTLAAYDEHTNNSSHSVKSNDFGRFMDMVGGNLLLGIPLNFKNTDTADIKTDSTRTSLRPTLDGGAAGVSITSGAGGTVNIEAPIIKGNGLTLGGGKQINYIAAIDSRDVSHTTTARNFLWQSEASTGSKTEVMHLASIQVPANNINFIGTGGISVQIPKGSNLAVQINTLAKQPGNEYLGELAKRSDIDWKQVELVNKTWDYSKSGLTQEAKIIVAIAVSFILPPGAGASLFGLQAGTVGAAMANAAVATLATQTSIAILNNKGDLGAALKELGSKDNVKALVVSIATAGVLDKIGAEFGLNKITATSPFMEQLGANLVNSVTSSLISTAVYGGSLETNLKNALKTGLINTAGVYGANAIGDLKLDDLSSGIAHAILGCAIGSASAGNSSGCAAGAAGGAAGEMAAKWYGTNVAGATPSDIVNFAKLTSAIVAGAGGADSMNLAVLTGENSAANNYLSHLELKDREIALKDCRAKNDPTCEVKVLQKYDAISAKNTAEINYNSVLEKGSLEEVKKGLENLLKDPAVSAESKQQAIKSLNEINVALNVIEKSPIIKNAAEIGLLTADILLLGELKAAKLLTTKVIKELVYKRTGAELSEIETAKISNNFYADGAQFSTNIINGKPVANLRLEYEQASRNLEPQTAKLLASGVSEEQVARMLVEQRNQLKLTYREATPPELLQIIETRNSLKYGSPVGPSVEQLRAQGKSWQDIIQSSARTGGLDLDFAPIGFNGFKK